jgi:predicted DNA binding CopG/RHH family protein
VPKTMHRSKPTGTLNVSNQSPNEERLTVRLTAPLNEIVRRAALYRGDISKTISQALKDVDLVKVKALDLDEAGELTGSTTIVIPSELVLRLKQAAKTRGSSMNLLINSALAKKFGYPSKENFRP